MLSTANFVNISVSYNDGIEEVRSSGEGIEREVFQILLAEYQADAARWLTPRADGQSTVTTTHSISTARSISASRLRNMETFGAIIAICLLRGLSVPMDPVVLHYFVHDCDLNSIHPQILGEWHPTLKKTIVEWLDVGPHGDISAFQEHFAIFHDMQVRTKFTIYDHKFVSHMLT